MNKDEEIKQLKERVAELEKEQEVLAWNLGGCSTLALGYEIGTKFCEKMARPALYDVNRLALKAEKLESQLKEKEAHCLEMVKTMKEIKNINQGLDNGSGEWKAQTCSEYADKALNSPTAKRYEAILDVVDKAKMFKKASCGEIRVTQQGLDDIYEDFERSVSTLEELEKE